jgi:large subunit ribosomal protein L24
MAAKIKKDDMVVVMHSLGAGRNGEVRGRVLRVDGEKQLVWVEKVKMVTRHRKGVPGQSESERIEKEAPIHVSNVMLVDPETNEPTRVGFKFVSDRSDDDVKRLESEGLPVPSRKVRYAKKSGAILD